MRSGIRTNYVDTSPVQTYSKKNYVLQWNLFESGNTISIWITTGPLKAYAVELCSDILLFELCHVRVILVSVVSYRAKYIPFMNNIQVVSVCISPKNFPTINFLFEIRPDFLRVTGNFWSNFQKLLRKARWYTPVTARQRPKESIDNRKLNLYAPQVLSVNGKTTTKNHIDSKNV